MFQETKIPNFFFYTSGSGCSEKASYILGSKFQSSKNEKTLYISGNGIFQPQV